MSSIMVPSCSGRIFAPALPPVQLTSIGTRHRKAALSVCRLPERIEASFQHRSSERLSRREGLTIRAAAAAEGQGFASDAGQPEQAKGWLAKQSESFNSLLHPFSDKAINAKLLALCLAQALCSVATLIHDTYLPIYLQDVLGLSNSKIGNLQALAQFLSNASKSLSGTLADILSPSRMIIFGTLLTTLNKPMFAASGYIYATFGTVITLYWVTAGKVFDRMSKGVREAPGKALIGELAAASGDRPEGAFGLRQAMATAGALVGASIAGLAYKLSGQNYTVTFALATVPATLALLLTISAFSDTAKSQAAAKKLAKEAKAAAADADEIQLSLVQKAKALAGALQPAYWQALIVVSLLYFARFDASFITLRARTVMSRAQLPLLTSVIMVTQAFISAPAGIRAKRSIKDRNQVLLFGYAAMIAADLTFAFLPTVYGMLIGAAFVGVHMALTHGVTLGMVASYIPATEVEGIGRITGTCWSFTDFIFGVILAYSNSVAGRLSDISVRANSGNIGCFLGGTVATLLSGLALVAFTSFGSLGKEEALTTKPKKAT
ncbi:hypothetical protein CVIRNUC_008704 [Coccomyxa viridis]|uniref:Major facilitator superfamily (MFS) profile domain-containing protein n=1 Tax=Coccomyxa viridis TaxID=1274662 RepID=A0AAV1IHJ6_9CHLO|nr:hypothetical protein CVIRNUC_008704 [Coccomyxa viridis]